MKKPKIFTRPRFKTKTFNPRKDRDSLYDTEWATYSKSFLRINPKCYACGRPSEVVDHLMAHKGKESLFKMLNNHIPLCKSHHDKITARFDRHEPPLYKEKLEYLAKVRLETGTTLVVRVLPHYGKKSLNLFEVGRPL